MMLEVIAANLVIFAAAVLQASTGVGFAMLAVPLLALISLAWVPAPMLICNLLLSFAILHHGRAALAPAEAPPLASGLVLGTAAGAALLTLLSREGMGVLIGAIIVVAVFASLLTPPVAITRARLAIAAFLGGALGVIAAMHGPPLIILYQREDPAKVRATMAGVFLFGCLLALGALWLTGLLGAEELRRGLLLLPGVGLGYLAGRSLAGRLSPQAARHGMLAISGAAGLALLLRSV